MERLREFMNIPVNGHVIGNLYPDINGKMQKVRLLENVVIIYMPEQGTLRTERTDPQLAAHQPP